MDIDISYNSHKYLPVKYKNEIHGSFTCNDNELNDLTNCPQIIHGDFDCSGQNGTRPFSLEGGPVRVDGTYFCNRNELTSLDGVAQYIGDCLSLEENRLSSLKDIHLRVHYAKGLYLDGNPIASHVLGVFLIKGLEMIVFAFASSHDTTLLKVQEIVRKHLKFGKAGLIKCQLELIANGLSEYAQI